MEGVPGVAEVAAVGVPRPGGGPERLVLHVVLKAGARGDGNPKTLLRACQAAVRTRLNPLFRVEQVRPGMLRTVAQRGFRIQDSLNPNHQVC